MALDPIDILMIVHERPEYTRLSLPRLLDTADDATRVWVWQNGDDPQTLEVVRAHRGHPRLYRFHHSRENVRLREPTNWLWENAQGRLFGKVDDDCLVPPGWIETLRRAHRDVPKLGVVACMHHRKEDLLPEAKQRIQVYGRHRVLLNCWVGGSGYLMKRECFEAEGPLAIDVVFTRYCIRLVKKGWVVGWYVPYLFQDHMDDPRSEHTRLRTDADLLAHLPLTARWTGVSTLAEWEQWQRDDALTILTASLDPRVHLNWRHEARRVLARLVRRLGVTRIPR